MICIATFKQNGITKRIELTMEQLDLFEYFVDNDMIDISDLKLDFVRREKGDEQIYNWRCG